MFLLNLFGRSASQGDDQNYDRISFKIDLNENVPKFQIFEENEYIEEEELGPKHPLYYKFFPKEEEHYVEYKTTENDTIFGLAIKLNISEKVIRQMNDLSASLYPGMKIKLPEGTDLSKLSEIPKQQSSKLKISEFLGSEERKQALLNVKYSVYYNAGINGNIKGTLSLNANYLIFNPSLDDKENNQKISGTERLLKFNAIVETVDIQDATYMDIPVMEDTDNPRKEAVVQFLLYRVGNLKIEKKYKERLKQLKLDHKAIASMTFIICPTEQRSAGEIGLELAQKVKILIKQMEEKGQPAELQQKSRLTNIPFFDIIHQSIQPKVEEIEKVITGKIINPSAVLGNLAEPSEILTPEEFGGIVKSMPVLYQLYNWVKVYGSTRDGSSFSTFLNRCSSVQPSVLLIKQHKGYKFGAFLAQTLHLGKSGRGQMFIFTFKDQEVPEIFHWTGENQSFVYAEKEMGVGIGMGFRYGIFIKHDLDKGSTSNTYTFGNKQKLSKKQDFYIDEVQVWGVDTSY